jgi:hypothetical protein
LQRCGGGPEAQDLAGSGSATLTTYAEQLRPLYAEYQRIAGVPVEERTAHQVVRMAELRERAAEIAGQMRAAGVEPRALSIYLRTLTGDERAYPDPERTVLADRNLTIDSSTGSEAVVNEEATFHWISTEHAWQSADAPATRERASDYRVTAPDGRTASYDTNSLFLRFDQEGRWRVSVDVRIITDGSVVTLVREVDVRDPGALADTITAQSGLAQRFERIQGQRGAAAGALIRANLELERIRVGRFRDFTAINSGRVPPYITSSDPNPVGANDDPDKKIHRYSVTPSRSGSLFRWYAVGTGPDLVVGGTWDILTATAGQTGFSGGIHNLRLERQVVGGDLVWGPPGGIGVVQGFRYPVTESGVVTIYCDECDQSGNVIATARYRQVILPQNEWARYSAIERQIARFAEYYPKIAEDTEVPISAVHVAKASGQTMETTFLLGRKTSDRNQYLLLDMTPGVARVEYESGSIDGLWDELNSGNSYPEGILRMTIPLNNHLGLGVRTVTLTTTGSSDWSDFAASTGWASLGLTALGVVASFIPGGQVVAAVCFVAGGVLGGVSAAANLYERLQQAEVSSTGVAVDVLSIASSFFGVSQAARMGAMGRQVALASRTGRFLLYAGFTTDAFAGVLVAVDTMRQIDAIMASGVERSVAINQIVRLLAMTALNGGMVMLSARDLTQVRDRVGGALGEARLRGLTSDQIHTLNLLDNSTLAALRNVPDSDLPALIEAIRRDPQAATADLARLRQIAAEGGPAPHEPSPAAQAAARRSAVVGAAAQNLDRPIDAGSAAQISRRFGMTIEIDPSRGGRSMVIEYTAGSWSRRMRMVLRVGPQASVGDVMVHAATMEQLAGYKVLSGDLRGLLSRAIAWVRGRRMPRRAEVLAELDKHEMMQEARLLALNSLELDPTTAATLRRDIAELEDILDRLRRELLNLGAPRGVIGASWGESVSQVQLEALLDVQGSGTTRYTHPTSGRPISEPGFRGGAPIDMGRAQARAAGNLRGATFPDVFGTEAAGRQVAMELKTPRQGETVASFFLRQDVMESFVVEIGGRVEHLPPGTAQVLVVDLRQTGQTVQQALSDLSTVLRNYGNRGDWRRVFEGARFITGSFSNPTLSPLQAIP